MRRAIPVPAILLLLLAPLVAEFLLGNLPITMLPALVVLAPMYGGGALLVREAARHRGRGWPTILVLGLAYGILEEAFTTQTLFNPDYLNLDLHLLQPAFIPALGMGGWWTMFVLTLHTVWSISVSVALTETLFPERETTPWLGTIGLSITSLVFLFGIVVTTRFTFANDRQHGSVFVASMAQFAGAAAACVLAVIAAFLFPRSSRATRAGAVPSPWLVGATGLAAGLVFLFIPSQWGWGAVGAYLALDVLVIGAVAYCARRASWDTRHRLALAAGAALAYAVHAFPQPPVTGADPMVDLVGNAVFAAAAIALIAVAAKRTSARRA